METEIILKNIIHELGDCNSIKFKYENGDSQLDRLRKVCSFIFAYNICVEDNKVPLRSMPRELIEKICDNIFLPEGGITITGHDIRIVSTEEERKKRLDLLFVNTVKDMCTLRMSQ